jgi:hypothetical protein
MNDCIEALAFEIAKNYVKLLPDTLRDKAVIENEKESNGIRVSINDIDPARVAFRKTHFANPNTTVFGIRYNSNSNKSPTRSIFVVADSYIRVFNHSIVLVGKFSSINNRYESTSDPEYKLLVKNTLKFLKKLGLCSAGSSRVFYTPGQVNKLTPEEVIQLFSTKMQIDWHNPEFAVTLF